MLFRFALAAAVLAVSGPGGAVTTMTGDLPRKDPAKPLETLAGLDIEYGSIRTSEGTRLRTILTRPAGTTGRLPAIFHTQAVSCGSLELPSDRPTRMGELARRSGMVLIRVERSGDGDSEGAACSKLDYDTEVRHYREALEQLSAHPWIDRDKIVIYGSSLGSTTAPLVAQGRKIAGILVQGGGAETYLERMINFDRLNMERSGKFRPDQIHREMLRHIPFQYEYLVRGKTPQQIEAERPELRGIWAVIDGEKDTHYGRPFAWHQQAAKRDFLTAWTTIEAPVLVIYGEYDQYEMREGHKIIADTVNKLRPGTATFLEIPGVDHGLMKYPSAEAAYREEGGQRDPELFLVPVIKWLKGLNLTAAAR